MKTKLQIILLIVFIVLPACSESKSDQKETNSRNTQSIDILMIGNSYTSQISSEFQSVFQSDESIQCNFQMLAPGGFQLKKHLETNQAKLQQLLDQKWDYVVIQEQSQTPAYAMKQGGKMLQDLDSGGPKLIELIHQKLPDATIIVYSTWARHIDDRETLQHFDQDPNEMLSYTTNGYRRIVYCNEENGWDHRAYCKFAPVGKAWQNWYAQFGSESKITRLHGPDHSHPSKLGKILASAVLYEIITEKPFSEIGFPMKDSFEIQNKPVIDQIAEIAHQAVKVESEYNRNQAD